MFRNIIRINIKKINQNRFSSTFSNNNLNNKEKDLIKLSIPVGIMTVSGYLYYINNKNFNHSDSNIVKENLENGNIKKITVVDDKKAFFETNEKNNILVLDIPNYKYIDEKLKINDIPLVFKNTENNSFIYNIILSSLFFGLFVILMRKQSGGFNNMLQFSKNNQINIMDNIKIKFSDIIGQNNAVNLIKEYLDIVKNFQKYKDIGAKIPKGALLHGPPGTGKTLLAKALAGESNLPFVSLSGSDLNAMFVGLGALKVKNLFEEARKKAEINKGCIVFIDEIDAIGQKRGTNGMNVNTERENTLNQLLTEMDGFEESKNIIILGATNRYEMLDPALLRPGRFDRKILVDLPNLSERRDLFKFYFNKLKTDIKDEELSNIIETSCKLTPGFSGADISNICNESAIISIRENNNTISENNIKKAIDYVMLGSEKENILSDKEKEIVAYHEAGHALISHILENTPNPIKVSITPREKGMLGFSQSEYPEQVLISKQNIEDQICVLMAGRICENIFINDITNGASNDIEKASELINKYLKLFCMSEENKFYKIKEKENSFNNEIGFKIKDDTDSKSIEILNQLYKKTENLILNNIDKIEKIKQSLIEKETIYKNEIDEIISFNSHPNKNYKK